MLKATGLTPKNITFADDAYGGIIQRYTREAGVRNLEREIASICRKLARKVVTHGKSFTEEISAESITEYLGVPRYRPMLAESENEIGVATGLAWTEAGGELLVTEATLMPGKGQLTLTGKLGDVMQESARAAMSYVRAKAEEFGIPKKFNSKTDVHVHVPEGAIPKDGPSAGITITTALVSALARIPTRRDVAMTGEITLRGKVLPVGGVKEKILVAHRAGLKAIVLPKDNEKDLAEIPKDVLDSLDLHLVDTMDEVLRIALAEPMRPSVPVESEPMQPSQSEESDHALVKILTGEFITSVAAGGELDYRRTSRHRPGRAFQRWQVQSNQRAREAPHRARWLDPRHDTTAQRVPCPCVGGRSRKGGVHVR